MSLYNYWVHTNNDLPDSSGLWWDEWLSLCLVDETHCCGAKGLLGCGFSGSSHHDYVEWATKQSLYFNAENDVAAEMSRWLDVKAELEVMDRKDEFLYRTQRHCPTCEHCTQEEEWIDTKTAKALAEMFRFYVKAGCRIVAAA